MLTQTTLRDGDGMVSFEIREAPPTDRRHLEMGWIGVSRKLAHQSAFLVEQDERGSRCPIVNYLT